MIEIYEKRGLWCLRDAQGQLHKFPTEQEAKDFLGFKEPTEEPTEDEKWFDGLWDSEEGEN
tara:strand:+ start:3379 stop:3561 length:183 start_codon:yes stop_codon:yes gene_type:complete